MGVKPKQRIISLHKPYLRPIVRGKETKPVEFGAKVHKVQVGGISFIEHLNFQAFNEGSCFKHCIYFAQSLTRRKTLAARADVIYATNANRRFATAQGIKTDFKSKGPGSKDYKTRDHLKALIQKERAARLEGSFGKDKGYCPKKCVKRTIIIFGLITTKNQRICILHNPNLQKLLKTLLRKKMDYLVEP